jgi:hypothetical protein
MDGSWSVSMTVKVGYIFTLLTSFGLSGCGFGVPEMNPFYPDQEFGTGSYSTQGKFENDVVDHIKCSIQKGLLRVAGYINGKPVPYVDWIFKDPNGWGTSINLTLQVDELSNANPGVTATNQWGNEIKILPLQQKAIFPQSFLFGASATGSAHSTRQETIQYTYSNAILLKEARDKLKQNPNGLLCDEGMDGFQIQSNLKIDDFIWDKGYHRSGWQ